mgnify:FL=1
MEISFYEVKQAEGILDELSDVKEKIEEKINLVKMVGNAKRVTLTNNKVMRICFLVGLFSVGKRDMEQVRGIVLSRNSQRIVASFFSTKNMISFSLYNS